MNADALTGLFEKFCAGDPAAVDQLFRVFEPYLRIVVRRQLAHQLRPKFDSADVVQSIWVRVLDRLRGGGVQLDSSDHLQAMLLLEARHRLTDRLRHYRRALERERSLPESDQTHAPMSRQPRPSQVAQASELWEKMLALCPPEHQELLRLKRQGLSLVEIAARTGLHEGSIRRIFRQLARQLTFRELAPPK
jgi:RNA polymerase sigma-70 factor (ECF subfamily)